MTANLPMGGNKVTGAADPTVSTDLATKNYVDTTTAAFFGTGDGKITLKTVADSGWILCDDGTFGSATSGSSNLASATTQALFTLFFNNLSDTAAPLLTSGGGATTRAGQTNAATAWAANCRMTLLKQLGRSIAVAGAGAGLTSRPLGSSVGVESFTLAANQVPSLALSGSVAVNAANGIPVASGTPTNAQVGNSGTNTAAVCSSGSWTYPSTIATNNTMAYTNASPAVISIMPPISFWNCMVKL